MKPIEKYLDGIWFRVQAYRFNGKCAICKTATEHPAHHIYARGKAVRWEINNGILLCDTCHKKAHKNVKAFRLHYGCDDLCKKFHSVAKDIDYNIIKLKLENYLKEAL